MDDRVRALILLFSFMAALLSYEVFKKKYGMKWIKEQFNKFLYKLGYEPIRLVPQHVSSINVDKYDWVLVRTEKVITYEDQMKIQAHAYLTPELFEKHLKEQMIQESVLPAISKMMIWTSPVGCNNGFDHKIIGQIYIGQKR